MSLGASSFLLVVGAVLTFAVNVSASGFNLNTVGIILMAADARAWSCHCCSGAASPPTGAAATRSWTNGRSAATSPSGASPTQEAVTLDAHRRFFYYCVCAAQDRAQTPRPPGPPEAGVYWFRTP